jgi:hypothetical protein
LRIINRRIVFIYIEFGINRSFFKKFNGVALGTVLISKICVGMAQVSLISCQPYCSSVCIFSGEAGKVVFNRYPGTADNRHLQMADNRYLETADNWYLGTSLLGA